MSFSIPNPSRLYALLLRLRPLDTGTIMPFSGELVHGAWLEWVRQAAPDVAATLHDGNRRRLFTCSSLQFPLPRSRVLQAERDNTHLPLDPRKTYTIRLTLLLGELFPLFYNSLMVFNSAESGGTKPPFIRIGKQVFLLEEVLSSPDDVSGWTGYTSFAALVEKVAAMKLGPNQALALHFDSLTTFNWRSPLNDRYGNHYAKLPLPGYVFPGLARRWRDLAPPELAGVVQKERVERYIEEEGMVVEDYDLRTHRVQFVGNPQVGFLGTCSYLLRGPDEHTTPDAPLTVGQSGYPQGVSLHVGGTQPIAPLTVRQQILLLAQFAFYCGVGYKTPMGMGRVRML